MTALAAGTSQTFRVLGLVGSAHFMSHVFNLALPPLFPLLVRDLGLTYTGLGLIMTAYGLAGALFTTPMGFLVDRMGGRRVLVCGLVGLGHGAMLTGIGRRSGGRVASGR